MRLLCELIARRLFAKGGGDLVDVGLGLLIFERRTVVLAKDNVGAQADVVGKLGVVVCAELGIVLLRHEAVVVGGVEGSKLLKLRTPYRHIPA